MKIQYFNKFVIILLLLLTASNLLVKAQNVTVKATIDSSSITIGDQVQFQIEFQQPINAKVEIPVIAEKINGQLEIIKTLPPDTLKEKSLYIIKYKYLITSFDSGSYTIPSYNIPYNIGNITDTLKTDSLVITVNYFKTDTATLIKDIKPPLKAPVNFAELWPYLAGFVGLLIIIALIWLYIKKRNKGGIFAFAKPIEPPHIIALRELDNLRTKKLWQSNKTKEYYVQLTEIVRNYIETRFSIQALEMTSDEIIEAFKYNNFIEPDSKILLRDLFTLADLVKFAKAQPLPDENEISMLNAYQFVNNTKITEMVESMDNNLESNNNEEVKQ